MAPWWLRNRAKAGGPVSDSDLTGLPLFTGAELFANCDGGFCPPSVQCSNSIYFDFSPQHDMAWNPATSSIYVPNRYNQVCELAVPALVLDTSVASFNYASYQQPHTPDCTDGKDDEVDEGAVLPAVANALLVYNSKLIGSLAIGYDNANNGIAFFSRSLDTDATGTTVGIDGLIAPGFFRYFNMGLCDIPAEWQAALGGPVMGIAGASYSIISTQSMGPSCASWDPDDIDGSHAMHPGNFLLGYPDEHRELGHYDDWPPPSEFYNFSTQVLGGFIPDGTRNMVFVGTMGARDSIYAGYGVGVATIGEHGVLYPDPETGPFMTCYDPPYVANSGGHCWPYKAYAWMYDLLDLAKVYAGTINPATSLPWQPWELRPVELFDLDTVFPIVLTDPANIHKAIGCAWNRVDRHLYMSQFGAGCGGGSGNGAIWRFTIPGTTP